MSTYKQLRQRALAWLLRATAGSHAQLSVARANLLRTAETEYDNQIKSDMEALAYTIKLAMMQIDAVNHQAKLLSSRVALHNLELQIADAELAAQEKISETTQNEAPPP